ncbi:hypothetical protein TNCV_4628491 [Trichonephila clavipes]|nr:hypothetical protein TNCV_4628491 [Trichonephila clavipes]
MDALKLPNQAPRGSGESLQNSTNYTVEPFRPLVLVRSPFELLHRALSTIVYTQYCCVGPISHPQSPYDSEMGRSHSV